MVPVQGRGAFMPVFGCLFCRCVYDLSLIHILYGMEVIDSGVAVLNMHAPMEVTSKSDVYEAKKGYLAFLLEA